MPYGRSVGDVWRATLNGRRGSTVSKSEISIEERLFALMGEAWNDAFDRRAPRHVAVVAAAPPSIRSAVARVLHRIASKLVAVFDEHAVCAAIERAIAAAREQSDCAALLLAVDAAGHGVALLLESPQRAAARPLQPYAFISAAAGAEEATTAVAALETILSVAWAVVPPQNGRRLRPWFDDERVARIGGRVVVREAQRGAARRTPAATTRSLFTTSEVFLAAGTTPEELRVRVRAADASAPGNGRFRIGIVAADRDELAVKLALAETFIESRRNARDARSGIVYVEDAPTEPRPLAFLFPGQGSQYAGMSADACAQLPLVREWFEGLDAAAPALRPSRVVFSAPRTEAEARELRRAVFDPEVGGQAGFVASMAFYDVLSAMHIAPAAMVGYSNGENATLLLAGIVQVRDRTTLFRKLDEIRQHADDAQSGGRMPKGRTIAVTGLARELVEAVIAPFAGEVFLSMDNCPSQVIVFGTSNAIGDAVERLQAAGALCTALPFDRAYHTPLFASRSEHVRIYYDSYEFQPPKTPVYSCATAALFPDDPDAARDLAALQWRSRVRFTETIEAMYAAGFRDFIEVGGAARLTGYVRDILRRRPHQATPCDSEGHSSIAQLQHVAVEAFVAGWNVDTSIFTPEPKIPHRITHPQMPDATRTAPRRPPPRTSATLAPPPVPPLMTANGMTSILQAHFHLMNEFLASQQRAFAAVTMEPEQAAAPPLDPRWPFLGRIIRRDGQALEAVRSFSPMFDGALRQHTLGRPEGGDEHSALAVLPFSIAMETMAEAAAAIAGDGYVVAAMRDVAAYRWVAVDHDEVHVRIAARTVAATNGGVDVEVTLFETPDPSGIVTGERAFEALVSMCRGYESGNAEIVPPSAPAVDARFNAADFYTYCLFHGPLFQMIDGLRAVGENGIEAVVVSPQYDDLIDGIAPRLQLPAILLDAPGQLIAYWLVENGRDFFGEFPFHVRSMTLHRRVDPGEPLQCRGRMRHDGPTSSGDFDFVARDGQLAIAVRGFSSKHFEFDVNYLAALIWPGPETFMSTDLALDDDAVIRLIDIPRETLTTSQTIWSRALARMTLRDDERAAWYALPDSPNRRADWLLGRVAAKEAVRVWAERRHGVALSPRGITIASGERGEPLVRCDHVDAPLFVSISHAGGRIAAAVSTRPVGIDHELIGREVPADAFSDVERSLGAPLLSLWCAREAAAKASGRGLEGAWERWRVAAVSRDGRDVAIEHEGIRYDVRIATGDAGLFAICTMKGDIR